MIFDIMWTATIENDKVCFEISGQTKIFNVSDFDQSDLATIDGKRSRCGGCQTLPLRGFDKNKKSWCDFSRKIAKLETFSHSD